MKLKRLVYDLDGVVVDFVHGFLRAARMMGETRLDKAPWSSYYGGHKEAFQYVWEAVYRDPEFWLHLNPREDALKHKATIMDQFCVGYVTARPVRSEVSAEWLRRFGFPERPVTTVPHYSTKVHEVIKLGGHGIVEDKFENFRDANKAGLDGYLVRTPFNNKKVCPPEWAHKKISSLNELANLAIIEEPS